MEQEKREAWHPGACSAIEIDLRKYKKHLQFIREVQLNKEPLRMDLLIIKKEPGVVIENDIGRIFSLYNIVEYKSPDDGLTIDDFYKVLCYACYYKSQGAAVDERLEEDITLSLIREAYPKKLIERLRKKYSIRQVSDGIYYVEGLMFRCQIVVTSQLDREHSSLRMLSRKAQKEDIGHFLSQLGSFDKEDKENADSLLEVCTTANRGLFHRIRKEDIDMCEALYEIFQDLIDERVDMRVEKIKEERKEKYIAEGREEGREEGRAEGREEGREEGTMKTLINLVKKGFLSVKVASEQANMTEQEFEALLSKA